MAVRGFRSAPTLKLPCHHLQHNITTLTQQPKTPISAVGAVSIRQGEDIAARRIRDPAEDLCESGCRCAGLFKRREKERMCRMRASCRRPREGTLSFLGVKAAFVFVLAGRAGHTGSRRLAGRDGDLAFTGDPHQQHAEHAARPPAKTSSVMPRTTLDNRSRIVHSAHWVNYHASIISHVTHALLPAAGRAPDVERQGMIKRMDVRPAIST